MTKQELQCKKLLELLNSQDSYERDKGFSALVPFIEKYNNSLPDKDHEQLLEHIVKKMNVLEDYSYIFELTENQKIQAIKTFNKKPHYLFKYEGLSDKLFSDKEKFLFKRKHRYRLVDRSIKSADMKTFFNTVGDILDQDLLDYVIDSIYNGKKKFSYKFLDKMIVTIERKKLKISEEDYDKLMSVKIMNELAM